MTKLAHKDGTGLVETEFTESEGIWAKDVTYDEHEDLHNKMLKDRPKMDELLLMQCKTYVRDEDGEEFENLQTTADIRRFGLRRIKMIVRACLRALDVKMT